MLARATSVRVPLHVLVSDATCYIALRALSGEVDLFVASSAIYLRSNLRLTEIERVSGAMQVANQPQDTAAHGFIVAVFITPSNASVGGPLKKCTLKMRR